MEITTSEQFVPYFDRIRKRTERVVACIPPERLEWRPAEGKFSFGDQVRHLAATERYMFAENVQDRPSRYPGCGRELADGWQAVNDYLARLHEESMEIFGALTAQQLAAKCATPAGIPITTWKWLRAMAEHEIHHRGQIYLMLGLIEVPTPPLFGLTSEEVQERSVS